MKNSLVIFFICAFNLLCNAQVFDGYGIKAGWGITNHDWQYVAPINGKLTWDNNSGFSIRAFTDFTLYRYVGLEAEIGYAQKGAKYKIPITTNSQPDGTGEYVDINNRLNYLSFSAVGKFKYNMSLISPYIIIGPQYNYLLSKQVSSLDKIVYDKFRNSSLGIVLGAGSEIKVLSVDFIAEYLYARDVTNNYNQSNIEIKNYSHTFLIGIKI